MAPDQESAGRGSRAANVMLAICAVGFVVALNLTPIYTSDFWIQLKVGDLIRLNGTIPDTVLFAFGEAQDFPFVAYEWLPSLLSSHFHAWFGYSGIIVLKCGLLLVVFGLVAGLCVQVRGNWTLSILLAALCMLGLNYRAQMRPELYGWICFLVSLNLIHAYLRTRSLVWLVALLPVSIFWANCHGSLLIGMVLPAMFATGIVLDEGWRNFRRGSVSADWSQSRSSGAALFAICFGIVLASLVNPFGFQLFEHVFTLSQSEYIKENIAEWRPLHSPDVMRGPAAVTYFLFAGLTAISVFINPRGIRPALGLQLLVFGALPFIAHRHLSWFVVIAVYTLAHTLDPLVIRRWRPATAIGGALLLVAGVGLSFQRGNVRGHFPGFGAESPLRPETIEYIRESGYVGNVFNSYGFGDQLVYHFYPEIRVAIDSRVDAYGDSYYRAYRSMSGRSYKRLGEPEALLKFLDENDIDWIVIRHYDYGNWQTRGHAAHLRVAGWKKIHRDANVFILERMPSD